MKNKFWEGFLIGITGLIIALAFVGSETKENRKKILVGWCLGTFCLLVAIGMVVGIIVGGVK